MTTLTKRDRQILNLMSEGQTEAYVCQRLGISAAVLNRVLDRVVAKLERRDPEVDSLSLVYERVLRRRAENHLRATRGRFTALLDAMPEAVLVVDGRTGLIKQANSRCEEVFGYSNGTLVGQTVELLVPPEHVRIHPAYRIGFLASVRKREMGYHPPIFGIRRDGTRLELAVALTASPADDDVMVLCTDYATWTAGVAAKRAEAGKG